LIIVKLYRLPISDSQDNPFTPVTIYNQLKQLDRDEHVDNDRVKYIGHLTADERHQWAPIYSQLASSTYISFVRLLSFDLKHEHMISFDMCLVPENRLFFETIHNSLFVLCLDENHSSLKQNSNDKNKYPTSIGLDFLHGNGTRFYTANRWFDKTLQVNAC
jgi:hypothetical protein